MPICLPHNQQNYTPGVQIDLFLKIAYCLTQMKSEWSIMQQLRETDLNIVTQVSFNNILFSEETKKWDEII